jgi:hypothetical protein
MERPAATPLNKFFCQGHAGGEGYEAYTGKEQQLEAHEAEKPNYARLYVVRAFRTVGLAI